MANTDVAFNLANLPVGSVVSTPFPDMEGNVAAKTSDGFWLITGELSLYTSSELADAADSPFTTLRTGYGEG